MNDAYWMVTTEAEDIRAKDRVIPAVIMAFSPLKPTPTLPVARVGKANPICASKTRLLFVM